MKKLISIIGIIYLFSCNGNDYTNKMMTISSHPKNVVILCDVSSSIDSSISSGKKKESIVFDKMILLSQSIIRAYEPESTFNFYVVSQNAASDPIFSFKSESWSAQTKIRVKNSFKVADSIIGKKIDSAYKNCEKYTCLLTSIERAYSVLRALRTQNSNDSSELIILSDMIEQCTESPSRKIMMNVQPGQSLLPKEQAEKLKNYKSDVINFDQANIKIKVILNTSGIDDIAKKELMKIWRSIFLNLGYKDILADPVSPFFEVPSFIKNKAYENF